MEFYGILNEIASAFSKPRNDGISAMTAILDGILDGILNEIASVALLPRNDGILYGILNEIAPSFFKASQ